MVGTPHTVGFEFVVDVFEELSSVLTVLIESQVLYIFERAV